MSEDVKYSILLPFLDDSHSFVHGYECGMISQIMDHKEPIDRTVHSANVEQLKMMADVYGYRINFEEFAPAMDPEGTYRRMIGAPGDYRQ